MAFVDITADLNLELMKQFQKENSALIESVNEPLTSLIKKPFNFDSIKSYQIVFPGIFKYYSPENSQFDLNEESEDDKLTLKNQSTGFIQNLAGIEGTLVRLSGELLTKCPNLIIPTQDLTKNRKEFCGINRGYIMETPVLLLNRDTNQRGKIPLLIGFYDFNLMENTQVPYKSRNIKPN